MNQLNANILFTKFTSDNVLTKTYTTEGNKQGGHMTAGTVTVKSVEGLEGFAQFIQSLNSKNALSYGVPKAYQVDQPLELTTKAKAGAGQLTRTTDNFTWSAGAGVFMLDYDKPADADALSKEELVAAIRQAMPELETVKMLWLPSSSSYIFNSKTQQYLSELKGQRLYFVVDKAEKIPDVAEILNQRLWLNDHGHIEISAAGSLLERSIIDSSVYQTQRLDFCGLAHCVKPIEKHNREPEIITGTSDMLKFSDVIQLTDEEKETVTAMVSAQKSVLKPKAEKLAAANIEAKTDAIFKANQKKTDRAVIRRQVEAAYRGGILSGEFQIIVVEDGNEKPVSVSEILSNKDRYQHCACLDPLEPEYNGRSVVGIIYTDGKANICSQAHGKRTFSMTDTVEILDSDTQPVCFDDNQLPEFPTEVLPEVIRAFVRQRAKVRQVPEDMAAQIALSVLSTCLQKKFVVRVGQNTDHVEQLSLWTVTAMPPASRKSDTVKDMVEVLNKYQRKELERMSVEVEKSRHDFDSWELEIKQLKQERARTKDSGKKAKAEADIRRLVEEKPAILHDLIVKVGADITPEGLTELLYKQNERMSIIDTEGASLFQILAGRYAANQDANLDPFLSSYCGDSVTVTRKHNGTVNLVKPALAIGVTVQPSVIFKATANADFNDRGLIGRFLCSIPKSMVGYRTLHLEKVSENERQTYEMLISTLLNIPVPEVESELLIDGEVFDFHQRNIFTPLEIGQRRGGCYEQLTAWAGKMAGTVARIAALFHVADDPTVSSRLISLSALERASKLIDYYAEHTKAALRLISVKGEISDAEKVLTWAYKAGKLESGFTLNEYFMAHRSTATTSDELMPIFNTLTNRQILIDNPSLRQKSRGRRPAHFFVVNKQCIKCQKCFAPPEK